MSSILTNNGAMVALQTLKGINNNLAKTQSEISTGKSIASAKDGAAIWAISKVMDSDVQGFRSISTSLALGQSTVSTARDTAEKVNTLLTQIKSYVVTAQEGNVDRAKIQTDIDVRVSQIKSFVSAAQFNGLNLLNNSSDTEGSGTVSILSSLDRGSDGTVSASHISIQKQDLATHAQVVDSAGTYTAGTGSATATLNATQSVTLTIDSVTAGTAYSFGMTGTDADDSAFAPADYTTAGTAAGAANIAYVARDGDTVADVMRNLASAFASYAAENELDSDVLNVTASGDTLTVTSGATDGTDTIAVRIDTVEGANVIGGGLAALSEMDVTTDEGARMALANIEGLIQTSINAASAFGSAQGRVEIQADFISQLTDSLRAGIGTLVDANMEEASARLQALQVQQQLGIQSLSIANQAPQAILSLFR